MNVKNIIQVLSLLALCAAAFFLVDPMHISMPDNMHMATLAGVVAIAGIFAVFVISENGGDERDDAHRALAGRVAFFMGAVVLITGVVAQTLSHALDPWLVWTLVAMTTGKVVARLVAEYTA